jgi:hypothetical protein
MIIQGPKYPGVTDGLVFYIDPKNRESWKGGSSMYNIVSDGPYSTVSGSGTNIGGDDWDGAVTDEGYFQFDGSDDYFSFTEFAGTDLMQTNGITTTLWLKISIPNYVLFNPFNTGTYMGAVNGGAWYYGGSVKGSCIEYQDGVVEDTPANDGEWHYYVFSGWNPTGSVRFNDDGLKFGGHSASWWMIDAYVGPLSFYDRAITATEVSKNFNAQRRRFGV